MNATVVGANSSETARRAVEAATRLAENFGAVLHIVSAYDAESFDAPGSSELQALNSESGAETLLQSLSSISKGEAVTTEVHSRKGNLADELLDVADRGMKSVRQVFGSVPTSLAHGHSVRCSVSVPSRSSPGVRYDGSVSPRKRRKTATSASTASDVRSSGEADPLTAMIWRS